MGYYIFWEVLVAFSVLHNRHSYKRRNIVSDDIFELQWFTIGDGVYYYLNSF